jgi:superfamily II DNA or RNA helicase
MFKDIQWPPSRVYRSNSKWLPFQFYMDVLSEAKHLDLFLGYFSSTAINYLSLGFAKFISSGGTVRIIINDVLSTKDKGLLKNVKDGNLYQIPFDISNFSELHARLTDYDSHFFNCLGWLIQNNRIQIKAIRPRNGKGIAHYKSGVFSDGIAEIGFDGSCNFTAAGLLNNIERITVVLPSDGEPMMAAIAENKNEFNLVFNGNADYVEYLDVEKIKEAITTHYGNSDIDELLMTENELLERKQEEFSGGHMRQIIDVTKQKIQQVLETPRFPTGHEPFTYQEKAYKDWCERGYKGIFAMATGTGKTITALNCLLHEYQKTGKYQAVIVVPTRILVDQWVKEAKQFNFRDIIRVGSGGNWKAAIQGKLAQIGFDLPTNYVVVITYASFNKPGFQDYLKKLDKDTIIIADEAHNVGSPLTSRVLPHIKLEKRIGLSATPKRVYDPEGSDKMEEFFEDHEPYTCTFTMEEAIEKDRLCQYFYYPYIVELQPEELEKYYEISRDLSRLYFLGNIENNERARNLLMQRKQIIHKAAGKLTTFRTILQRMHQEKGRFDYTLIYAPEGYYSDEEFPYDEEFEDLDEENRIIDYYARIIRGNYPDTTVTQYTSETADKENVLSQFTQGNIDLLLSMKCLDEGVDIPRTEQAIFCSSTGNPRQFIQRRGRILRKAKGKDFATIYDMVVIPSVTSPAENFDMEQSLVKKELERVVHFAYMSINKYDAIATFEDVCHHYNLNLDTIHLELQ